MKKILIIIFIFILTGCWNYKELNNCAIVTGMAIDCDENNYIVSLLFSNSTKEGKNTSMLSGEGETIHEAIKKISLSVPKELYISHLSCIIISDDVAKKGITPVLDYLLREPESNQNFNLIISKDFKAQDILSVITPLSDYPSQNINSTIKVSEKEQARVIKSNFNQFISTLLNPGINPVANSITLIDDKKNTKIDNLAIFKKDRLIDWATTDESIGINMLKGNVKNLYTNININDTNIVITCTKYKIKKEYKNNKFIVNIYCEGGIKEIDNKINIKDKKILDEIEKETIKELKEYTDSAIIKSQNLKDDILGYGNYIYKHNRKSFEKINDWDEYFSKLDIEVNINFKLINVGSTLESIGELSK